MQGVLTIFFLFFRGDVPCHVCSRHLEHCPHSIYPYLYCYLCTWDIIHVYSRYLGVPVDTQSRINEYFDYLTTYQHPGPEAISLLNQLPHSMFQDIMTWMFFGRVNKVRLLHIHNACSIKAVQALKAGPRPKAVDNTLRLFCTLLDVRKGLRGTHCFPVPTKGVPRSNLCERVHHAVFNAIQVIITSHLQRPRLCLRCPFLWAEWSYSLQSL